VLDVRETVVMGVEGGGGGVEMAGPAGMGEGDGVDIHGGGGKRGDEGVWIRRVFAP
jgi:hypothetical protein